MVAKLTSVLAPVPVRGEYWVYILQSEDGGLYVGQSDNVPERVRKHQYGIGSKFTHDHPGLVLVHVEGPFSRAAAVAREAQLKRWSRAKKEALIRGDVGGLKQLSRSHDGTR